MAEVREGELVFSFPLGSKFLRFDEEARSLSHCMKAVYFIVEFSDFVLFVEVKDPEHSRAKPSDRRRFVQQIRESSFVLDVTRKYRDSFLYRWAEARVDKPIRYVLLLEVQAFGSAELLTLTNELKRMLPLVGLPSSWKRPIADNAAVLNMAEWNRLRRYGKVRRVRGAASRATEPV